MATLTNRFATFLEFCGKSFHSKYGNYCTQTCFSYIMCRNGNGLADYFQSLEVFDILVRMELHIYPASILL